MKKIVILLLLVLSTITSMAQDASAGEGLRRPQAPQPPFPYTTEEVSFDNAGFTFHGTLTLPEGTSSATPVFVMVTGSGQQNRDEEWMDHRPFAVIADVLARRGIATMRFDDRGWEDPDFPFLNYTLDDHKTDAEAAVRLMRHRFSRVGVIGHSGGGTIALMLAAEGKVDYCVTLAAMAVSGRETLLDQSRTMMPLSGVPAEVVEAYCVAYDKAMADLVAGKSVAEIDCITVPETMRGDFKETIDELATPFFRHLLKTDVSKILDSVTCPVLALNGCSDTQVRAEINLGAIDAGLTNSPHEVVYLDGLNHLFQHCHTGLLSEYALIEETIAPEVLDKVVQWVHDQHPKMRSKPLRKRR